MSPSRSTPSRRRIAGERRTGTPRPVGTEAEGRPGDGGPGEPDQPTATGPGTDQPTDRAADRPTVTDGRTVTEERTVTDEPEPAGVPARTGHRDGPSWPVLAVLGVLALALVVAAVVLGTFVWSYGQVRHDDQVDQAGRTATSAAERAATPILSYDYRSLPADQKAAEKFMTPSYRKQYDASFTKLVEPNAPKLHARVSAAVKASGVMLPASPNRVDVLVYVNQTTTSTANGGEPQVALNRAKFSMVRNGSNGPWLVDKIVSY